MPLLRYTASADTTIVNAFQPNLRTRGTGANAGMADVMEVFSIYGRQATGSQELSRILVKFPITNISTDRTNSVIPASGSVSFYMRLFSAVTSKTVPRDFKLVVAAVSQSWQEGVGLDLEGYADLTKGNTGANWMSASDSAAWTSVGGDYLTSSSDLFFEQTFESGLEDVEINITPLVESWIAGTQDNYGVEVLLSSSYEAYFSSSSGVDSGSVIQNTVGATKSYYTKRFFARGSQYFFKRPIIEARWSDITRDDRGDFMLSSSRAPAVDNLNTLYFYNIVRGRLTNLPNLGVDNRVYVSMFSGNAGNTAPSGAAVDLSADNSGFVRAAALTVVTGGLISTGIYSASFAMTAATTAVSPLYDVWFTGSDMSLATTAEIQYFTGSFKPQTLSTGLTLEPPRYVINITNLKSTYDSLETARLRLYTRNKNWNPTIYTVATTDPPSTSIISASYRVYRVLDGYEAVKYGTGSDFHTGLSYDVSGNYFDFDMSLLEPGYMYAFKFAFYNEQVKSWQEQNTTFKFKVENNNP
jgi:hypothetical protein